MNNMKMDHEPGGSTLKTHKCRKSTLFDSFKSLEETDHGSGGRHAKTWAENGLASISFSIKTNCNSQDQNILSKNQV